MKKIITYLVAGIIILIVGVYAARNIIVKNILLVHDPLMQRRNLQK